MEFRPEPGAHRLHLCRSRLATLQALPDDEARWVQLRTACCALLLRSLVAPPPGRVPNFSPPSVPCVPTQVLTSARAAS